MSKIVLLMGLPCTGKTTYSRSMKGIRVELDQLRKGSTGSYKTDGNFDNLVHYLAQKSIQFYLTQGKAVIVDGRFLSRKKRELYINLSKQLGCEIELFWFDPSLEFVLSRVDERNRYEDEDRKITFQQIQEFSKRMEIPTIDEGFSFIHYLTEEDLIS